MLIMTLCLTKTQKKYFESVYLNLLNFLYTEIIIFIFKMKKKIFLISFSLIVIKLQENLLNYKNNNYNNIKI